jgi:hypothetical protein
MLPDPDKDKQKKIFRQTAINENGGDKTTE